MISNLFTTRLNKEAIDFIYKKVLKHKARIWVDGFYLKLSYVDVGPTRVNSIYKKGKWQTDYGNWEIKHAYVPWSKGRKLK